MKLKKVHVYLFLPFIFSALWLSLFYYPLGAAVEENKKKLTELRKEREKVEREVEYLFQINRKSKELEATLRELKSKIPEIGGSVTFLKEMVSEGRKKGVRVETITSLFSSFKSLEGKRFVYPVFEVTLKGRFVEMGKFLEDLNEKEVVSGIIGGRLYVDEREYPNVTGKITLEIRAFKEGI